MDYIQHKIASQITRVLLGSGLLCLMLFALITSAEPTTKHYNIDEAVNSFDATNTVETKVGYQYWFADKSFANGKTLKLSVVGPHQATHAPHKHAEDEFFFILEGTAEFYLDGETRTAGPMTSFYCPSWQMHGIKNTGDTELKYLVVKQYLTSEE